MKLTEDVVKKISNIKYELDWMKEFRLNSFECFSKFDNPSWGPKINIDFDLNDLLWNKLAIIDDTNYQLPGLTISQDNTLGAIEGDEVLIETSPNSKNTIIKI